MEHVLQNIIADKEELKWYFDNCVFQPEPWESYSMVLVCRHKKLSEEERLQTGLTRAEAEFLKVETVRLPKFTSSKKEQLTFEKFYKTVCRLNFDKEAYLTPTGDYLPSKTLAVLFYVNPCDDIKVYDAVREKVEGKRTGLIKAGLNGNKLEDYLADVQTFGNLDNLIKHAKALSKGNTYWLDFDLDVPEWWKKGKYADMMKTTLTELFGKGNYVIIETTGGYHILVRTLSVKGNPHRFTKKMGEYYLQAVKEGNPPYKDKNGKLKFECVMSGKSIPGVPLPGTYQYDNVVRVINKEDFE